MSVENNYCKLQQAHDQKCRVSLRFYKTNGQMAETVAMSLRLYESNLHFMAITGRHLIQLNRISTVSLQSQDRRYVM